MRSSDTRINSGTTPRYGWRCGTCDITFTSSDSSKSLEAADRHLRSDEHLLSKIRAEGKYDL